MAEEPTKPQSAYWLWLSENREALAKEVGDQQEGVMFQWAEVASADITKLAGQKWKVLPDVTKKLFRAKADELKEEYYEKMATSFVAGGVVKGVCRTEKKEAKDKKEEWEGLRDGPEGGAGGFGTAEEAAALLLDLAGWRAHSASPSRRKRQRRVREGFAEVESKAGQRRERGG